MEVEFDFAYTNYFSTAAVQVHDPFGNSPFLFSKPTGLDQRWTSPDLVIDVTEIDPQEQQFKIIYREPGPGGVVKVEYTYQKLAAAGALDKGVRFTLTQAGVTKTWEYRGEVTTTGRTWQEVEPDGSLVTGIEPAWVTNTTRTIQKTRKALVNGQLELVGEDSEEQFLFYGPDGPTVQTTQRTISTGGDTLTTSYSYFNDAADKRWGKLKSVTNPDGSWVRYEYEPFTGETVRTYRPWKSLVTDPTAATLQNSVVNSMVARDPMNWRLLWDIESKAGHVTARTWNKNWWANPDEIPTTVVWSSTSRSAIDPTAFFRTMFPSASETAVNTTARVASSNPNDPNSAGYRWQPNAAQVSLPQGLYDINMTQRFTADYSLWDGSLTVADFQSPINLELPVVRSIDSAGRMTHTDYAQGAFNEVISNGKSTGTFNWNGAGSALRTTSSRYAVDPETFELLDAQPITQITEVDYKGMLRKELKMKSGNLVELTSYVYDAEGREQVETWKNSRRTRFTERISGTETREHDESGMITQTLTDDGGELISTAKLGVSYGGVTEPNIVTTTEVLGLTTTTKTKAGNLVRVSSSTQDMAGRVVSSTDEDGLTTEYAYELGGRRVTETLPNGGTRITENYIDGQLKSISGTAVPVHEFHDYEVTEAGNTVHTVYFGSSTAATSRWARTTTNGLGWVLREEKPSPASDTATLVTEHFYNTKGQKYKTTRTGLAPTLYVYDWFGELVAQGQDYNNNGQLDLKSTEPITVTDARYVSEGGVWYFEQRTAQFTSEADVAPSVVSRTVRQRLGSNLLITTEKNSDGSVLTSTTTIDPSSRTTIISRASNRTGLADVQTIVNGQLRLHSTALSTTATQYFYDGLERVTKVIDPSGLATKTEYDDWTVGTETRARGRVKKAYTRPVGLTQETDFVLDVTHDYGGQGTTGAGLLIASTNAAGDVVKQSYDLAGRVTATFGSGTYPVRYGYNALGERTTLQTFRNAYGGGADGSPPLTGGDLTTWAYHSRSGALYSKTDAATRAVTYTYHPSGLLHTRTWARTLPGADSSAPAVPLTTTYLYDLAGRSTSVTHSDDTPDVSYQYYRSGAVKRIVDGSGTRDFSQPTALAGGSRTETISVSGYPTAIVRDSFNSSGQRTGWDLRLNNVTLAKAGFTYDTAGRLDTVSEGSGMAGYQYRYHTGSGRIAGVNQRSSANAPWSTLMTRRLDSRLRVDRLYYGGSATSATGAVLGWDYQYDPDRPEKRKFTTSLVPELPGWAYGYNSRGEVTGASRSAAGSPAPTAAAVPGQSWGYGYDDIGNRTASTRGLSGESATGGIRSTSYNRNNLNQYTYITRPDALEVSGVTADASLVPTLKINGQPASGRPPGNGEPGGYAQWLDGLVEFNATTFSWAEILVEAKGNNATETSKRRGYLPLPNNATPIYDRDGNLTEDNWGRYTWDAENRLSSAEMRYAGTALPPELPAKRLEFRYDAQGRRVLKRLLVKTCPRNGQGIYGARETNWRLVREHRFWYDGWNLMAETVDSPNTNSQVYRRYLWGLDLSGTAQGAGGVGGLLCVMTDVAALNGSGSSVTSLTQGPLKVYSAASDVNGNVMGLIDPSTGTLQARWDYDPFGNTVTDWYAPGSQTNSLSNPFRFSSKFLDEETGWYYYGFRYMDPVNGRFIGRDPIGEKGGLNLFGFCENDGVDQWDYLGMKKIKIAFAQDVSMKNSRQLGGQARLNFMANVQMETLLEVLKKCAEMVGAVDASGSLVEWTNVEPSAQIGDNPVPDIPSIRPWGERQDPNTTLPSIGFEEASKIKWPNDATFRVLFTGQWTDGNKRLNGAAGKGTVIILNKSALKYTLPHEMGHVMGWKDTKSGDDHSSDQNNLMSAGGPGITPDCRWCNLISSYAK